MRIHYAVMLAVAVALSLGFGQTAGKSWRAMRAVDQRGLYKHLVVDRRNRLCYVTLQ